MVAGSVPGRVERNNIGMPKALSRGISAFDVR